MRQQNERCGRIGGEMFIPPYPSFKDANPLVVAYSIGQYPSLSIFTDKEKLPGTHQINVVLVLILLTRVQVLSFQPS